MGQYYKPVCLETKEFVCSHSYGSGLKLMEHSWVGNHFVAAVEKLITKGGAWFGKPIVWAGDYADCERDKKGFKILNEAKEEVTLYELAEAELKPEIDQKKEHKPMRYLVNLDKALYVDITKVPVTNWCEWQIHPLPLLTCEGNGRGGGDFRGESDLVGAWARDRVIMENTKPKNCKELIFDVVED